MQAHARITQGKQFDSNLEDTTLIHELQVPSSAYIMKSQVYHAAEGFLGAVRHWDNDMDLTLQYHSHYRISTTPASLCHSTCLSRSPHVHTNVWIATLLMAFLFPTNHQKIWIRLHCKWLHPYVIPSVYISIHSSCLALTALIQYITSQQYCYYKMHQETYWLQTLQTWKRSRNPQCSGICMVGKAWKQIHFHKVFRVHCILYTTVSTYSASAWEIFII